MESACDYEEGRRGAAMCNAVLHDGPVATPRRTSRLPRLPLPEVPALPIQQGQQRAPRSKSKIEQGHKCGPSLSYSEFVFNKVHLLYHDRELGNTGNWPVA